MRSLSKADMERDIAVVWIYFEVSVTNPISLSRKYRKGYLNIYNIVIESCQQEIYICEC